MQRQISVFLIVIAVTIITTTADAQNRGGRGGRGGGDPAAFMQRMFENDANSDGKLSAEELGERGARILERADSNSDGFLTKDEFTKMMENRRGPRGRGENGGRARGPGRAMDTESTPSPAMPPILKALDKDSNGSLSEEEINNAVNVIKSLDKDKDGQVSVEEMIGDLLRPGRGERDAGRPERDGGGDRSRRQRPERDDSSGLRTGQSAPDFELKALDGKTETKLSDLYAKKPVVLLFGSYT